MHTDANTIAGLLQAVFGEDITTAPRTCQSCRQEHPIGAHPVYEGAGWVLRCPNCADVAGVVVEHRERYAITLHGTWYLGQVG
jgi:Family of unknown function (DUF6510)